MILTVILFQGVIFMGLIFIMRQFMKGHVSGAMGHLQKLNEDLIKQQKDLKEKMSESQREHEMKMNKLEQDINSQQTRAREEANKTIEETKTRALSEREKIINEAVSTRDKMKLEVMSEMEEKSVQHAKTMVAEFLQGDLKTLTHENLVLQALEGIKDLPMESYQITPGQTGIIRTAEPLSEDLKKKISKVFQEKVKGEVVFKEEVDSELVAGIVLKVGNLVIDGSLVNRLGEAAARIKKETIRKYQKAM